MAGILILRTKTVFVPKTILIILFLWSGTVSAGGDHPVVTGLFELETAMANKGSGSVTTPPGMSNNELEFNVPISGSFGALARFKHEDQVSGIDEAYLRYQFGDSKQFRIVAGTAYLPFGQFETSLISDPLTLTVGKTRSLALALTSENGQWLTSIFALPDSDAAGAGDTMAGGAGVRYQRGEDWHGYAFGFSAISNIIAADGVASALGNPGANAKPVPALAIDAEFGTGKYRVLLESVMTTDRFAVGDLGYVGVGAQPSAWRIELARRYQAWRVPLIATASWQQSREAVALDLPETRLAAGFAAELSGSAILAIEWARDAAYPTSVGGSGDIGDRLTLKLALTF